MIMGSVRHGRPHALWALMAPAGANMAHVEHAKGGGSDTPYSRTIDETSFMTMENLLS